MTDPIAGALGTPNWKYIRLRPDADAQYALWVDLRKGNKTISSVAAGTVKGTLLAANKNRVVAMFYNGGTVDAYLGGSNVSTSNYAYKIAAGGQFIDDASWDDWWVVTASGTGDVKVTEVA